MPSLNRLYLDRPPLHHVVTHLTETYQGPGIHSYQSHRPLRPALPITWFSQEPSVPPALIPMEPTTDEPPNDKIRSSSTGQLAALPSSSIDPGPNPSATQTSTTDRPSDQPPILKWLSHGGLAPHDPTLLSHSSEASTASTLHSLPVTKAGHSSQNLVLDRCPKPKKARPKKAKPSTVPRKKSITAKASTHGNIAKWLTPEPNPSIPD